MATATAVAGPSRLVSRADSGTIEHLPAIPPSAYHGQSSLSVEVQPANAATSLRPGLKSGAASIAASTSDSGSGRSVSLRSLTSRDQGFANIFNRRGSVLTSLRRPGSSTASQRSSNLHDDGSEHFEMTAVPLRGIGKKRVVENLEARAERVKAEAALVKWRKWIAENPAQPPEPQSIHILAPTPSNTPRAQTPNPLFQLTQRDPLSRRGSSENTPARVSPTPGTPAGASPASIERAGPSQVNGEAGASSEASPSGGHYAARPRSHLSSHGQDIYTTESVRALRDVELAVDPEYFGGDTVSPLSRQRRLSTHARVSDMPNPFSNIDSLLCRRGIRPLVLELVQALGAYIDAVWFITFPHRPCPWTGVPIPSAARRASLLDKTPLPKAWRSWTITAVQEGKRRGFLSNPPTAADVAFWGWEIRYGLRDIDEAVNRRKDLGWAFGESVIRGQYGDIVPGNVSSPSGAGGNVARLLNDLEEALWGDAMPAPTDLAYEHEPDFDPFSVYREGDELIGVEMMRSPDAREAELRKVFGGYLPSLDHHASHGWQGASPVRTLTSVPDSNGPPVSPDHVPPALSLSPKSRCDPTPQTPADTNLVPLPDLDFSVLGTLQELSMEEKLELGRRRHREYLERTRAEEDGGDDKQQQVHTPHMQVEEQVPAVGQAM